jgi:hypothetical protein
MHWPMGSRPGHSTPAIASLTTAAPVRDPRLHHVEELRRRKLHVEATERRDRVDAVDIQVGRVRREEPAVDAGRRHHTGNGLRMGKQAASHRHATDAVHLEPAVVGQDLEHGPHVVTEGNRAGILDAPHEKCGANEQYDGQRCLAEREGRAQA